MGHESRIAGRDARRLRLELAATALLGLALAGIAAAITAANVSGEGAALAAFARALIVAVPIAVGSYASYQRPSDRFGRLLVAVGVVWFLTTLAESDDGVLYSVGRICGWLVEVGLLWLVLAFPSARLTTRIDRALVWGAVGLIALLYLPTAPLIESFAAPSPWSSCSADCPNNAFFVLGSEPAVIHSFVVPARELLTILIFGAVTVRLVQRVRDASPLMRRTVAPLLTVAIARLVILAVAIGTRRVTPDSPVVEVFAWAVALAVPAVAVAFFVGLFRHRLYVADALQRFGLGVRSRLAPDELRDVMSAAMQDSSLELAYWANRGRNRWVDASGNEVRPPAPGSGRCLTEVRDGGRLVAGIIHDSAIRVEQEFVEAIGAYALLALENRRLAAKVDLSIRDLRASRARIVASADTERRRIERDLHDGAQQNLIALGIQLELTEELLRVDPEGGRAKLHALRAEVNATVNEIRALAHGIYPSLLADRGLAEALRAAARRAPIPATVHPDGVGRYPHAVESAVYFCCLEAMQNASKHALDASAIEVVLTQDDALRFEVRDDGVGFNADTARGAGLTGMRDRLAAVGGKIAIRSGPAGGTVVAGSVPRDAARHAVRPSADARSGRPSSSHPSRRAPSA